jgi:hypothetical protein
VAGGLEYPDRPGDTRSTQERCSRPIPVVVCMDQAEPVGLVKCRSL